MRIAMGGLFLTLMVGGCADSQTADVTGAVTFDGKAVDGAITFEPVDGNTPTAGGEIKNGRYSARVPVGLMKVSISVPKVVGTKKLYDRADSPEMPITAEALPARYNRETELQLDVKPGKNDKDFDLHSK